MSYPNVCYCGCGNVVSGRGKWFSDAHRMAFKRKPEHPKPEQEPEQVKPEQSDFMHIRQAIQAGRGSVINCGDWKPIDLLGDREFNRVSLPGDLDYG